MKLFLRAFCVTFFATIAVPAAVLVTLTNGSQLEAVSEARDGSSLILTVGSGTIVLPADQVSRIEKLADPPASNPVADTTRQTGEDKLSVNQILARASDAQGLPVEFVQSVAKVESGLRSQAVSVKGAMGLMQLMPATAATLGVKRENPEENAMGGVKYLRELLIRYNNESVLALAAYNAGPGAVDRYHGVPPYRETIAYIQRVLKEYEKAQQRRAHNSTTAAAAPSLVR